MLTNHRALRSAYSAGTLKSVLKDLVDDGDRIVVTEVGAEWASRRGRANL